MEKPYVQKEFSLEREYKNLETEHNLPVFGELIKDFDIEKIIDKETDFLAREIRRVINEKITAYLHLFETLINPQSPPLFVFKILKNISEKEKQQIQQFYKILSRTQIKIMKLDTIYSESKEIEFINNVFEVWQNIKVDIYELLGSFQENFENDDTSKEQSYFD